MTHKSEVYSTDTLVKSLQRAEGLLWQKDPTDPYHQKNGPSQKLQKTYQQSPPQLDFLPPSYDRSPRNFEYNRNYDAYQRFDQQQLSPRDRIDMHRADQNKGQKRYRS